MARTILRDAEGVIEDESFAALEPETVRSTVGLVLETAPTVVVIAHP